jgi:adenosylcobinamide kinase/adenosylcobinamide-phosphate guanylyltransferase
MTHSTVKPKQIILVTGASRSGKSEWAEQLADRTAKSVVYIATALENRKDEEWQARIHRHRQRRPDRWQTQEIPEAIAVFIRQAPADRCLLVDSIGTWLANCLEQENEQWQQTYRDFLQSLEITHADLILVAEEVGWGVVPAYPLGRLFRDRLGDLTRRVGAIADAVYLVTGGYALNLCQLGVPLPPPEL